MKARQFLRAEIHDPETLRVVFEAFDAAWAEIEKDYPEGHATRDAIRQHLATVMLSFVQSAARDSRTLKELSLAALRR